MEGEVVDGVAKPPPSFTKSYSSCIVQMGGLPLLASHPALVKFSRSSHPLGQ